MQYFAFRCIYRVEPRKNGPTNHCCSTFFSNFVISKIVPLQINKNDYEKVLYIYAGFGIMYWVQ